MASLALWVYVVFGSLDRVVAVVFVFWVLPLHFAYASHGPPLCALVSNGVTERTLCLTRHHADVHGL